MNERPTWTTQTYARAAGVAYLAIIITPIVSLALLESPLIVDGDASATSANIAAHPTLFRLALVLHLLMFVGVVFLAVAHHVLLRSVDRDLSSIALAFRGGEAIVGCVTVLMGAMAASVASAEGWDVGPRAGMVELLLTARDAGMQIALVLLAVGAILFCRLFYVSGFIPRALAAYGVGCYALLLVASVANVLEPSMAEWTAVAFVPGAIFELTIGARLLFKGIGERPAVAMTGRLGAHARG